MRLSQESQLQPRDAEAAAAASESTSLNAAAAALTALDRCAAAPASAAVPPAASPAAAAFAPTGDHARSDVAAPGAEQLSQEQLQSPETTKQYSGVAVETAVATVRTQLQQVGQAEPRLSVMAADQLQPPPLPAPRASSSSSGGGGGGGVSSGPTAVVAALTRQPRRDGTGSDLGSVPCGDQSKAPAPRALTTSSSSSGAAAVGGGGSSGCCESGSAPASPPPVAEEYIVRVRGQVMERDKATDLWAPVRHYPWCIVGLLQRHTVNGAGGADLSCGQAPDASASAAEYFIRGRRLHDSQEVICCNVDAGLQYSVANPTFHHWSTVADDGSSRGSCGGVLFVNASDAARFEKHVRRALSHVSDGHVVLPKSATTPTTSEAAAADFPAATPRASGIATAAALCPLPTPPGVLAGRLSRDKPRPRLPMPADVAQAAAVDGHAVSASIEDSWDNNNWPAVPADGKHLLVTRTTTQPLPDAAAGSRGLLLNPRLMPAAREDAEVWTATTTAVHRTSSRLSSDRGGSSAMHDYRTGEMPCTARWTPVAGNQRRSSPTDASERQQQLQLAAAGHSAVARDYRRMDAIDVHHSLTALDGHVELKLPVRAKTPGGRKCSRFVSSRTWMSLRRPLNVGSASSDDDDGDNHVKGTQAAIGKRQTKGLTKTLCVANNRLPARNHHRCSKRSCCCCIDTDIALPSNGECDDDTSCMAPSLCTAVRPENGGGGTLRRVLLRLLCCCWCLPRAAHRRLHSSGSSSVSDSLRGRHLIGSAVTSSPPPVRKHAITTQVPPDRGS